MKNFQKKHGLFAVAAVLLAVAVILVTITCSNDIGSGYNDEFTPPAGKGAVRLNFNDQIQRTILPDNVTINSFDEFEFIFQPTTGSALNFSVAKADKDKPIVLDPGNYNLTVIGFFDFGTVGSPDMKAAATNDTAVPVTITAAQITTKQITLKAYAPDGVAEGTFKYKITTDLHLGDGTTLDPSDIDTAYMYLTKIGAVSPDLSVDISTEIDVAGTASFHEETVVAGYYYLDFKIVLTDGDEIIFRHVIHIYQNMTSTYEFNISKNYFSAKFLGDLSYEHPQDFPPILADYTAATGNNILDEGETIELLQGSDKTINVTNSSDFDGGLNWYCQDDSAKTISSGTFQVEASSGKFFNAKKTYLLTVVGKKGSLSYYTYINVKVVSSSSTIIPYPTLEYGGSNPVLANGTVNVAIGSATAETITVSNSSFFDTYEWYVDGEEDVSTTSSTYIVNTDVGGLFENAKTYKLKVIGIKGDIKRSTTINIQVP